MKDIIEVKKKKPEMTREELLDKLADFVIDSYFKQLPPLPNKDFSPIPPFPKASKRSKAPVVESV